MSIIVRREQNQGRQRKARGQMFMDRRGGGSGPGGRGGVPHPPPIRSYGITRDVRLRFVAGASIAKQITYQNLLDTVLLATTAVVGYDLFDAVRLNSVEAWAVPVIGGSNYITVLFNGEATGSVGDQKNHTDSSMGIQPAHVRARPDPLSQAAQFQTGAANAAFELVCPQGTIVDVSMTLRQPVFGQATAAQNALVGATPGAVYYRGLDGLAISATQLQPVGVAATI